MSNIKERIKQYLKHKNITQYQFYKDSKLTGLFNTEHGVNENSLVSFIEYAKDVDLTWLITGKGKMLVGNIQPKPIIDYVISPVDIAKELEKLRIEFSEFKDHILKAYEKPAKPTKNKK